ncbi:MAG: hypothetical protein AB8F74_16655 [Saprospiraceae bacterium]
MLRPSVIILWLSIIFLSQSCTRFPVLIDWETKPGNEHPRKKFARYKHMKMPVYQNEKRPSRPYDLVAKIVATGNNLSTKKKLIYCLRKEAAYFRSDAIIITGKRYVKRTGPNATEEFFNILASAAAGDDGMDTSSSIHEYNVLVLEAIAIRYSD